MSESLIFMSYGRDPNTIMFVKQLKSDLENAGFKYVCVYLRMYTCLYYIMQDNTTVVYKL